MKTEKLSLDAFKKMADKVQTEELLETITGGLEAAKWDCHLTGIIEVDTKLIASK